MKVKRIALISALLAFSAMVVHAQQLNRIKSLMEIEDYESAIMALEQIVKTERPFDEDARYLLAKCYYLSPREVSELRPKTFTVGKEKVTGVESVTVNVNREKCKAQLRIISNLKGGLKKLVSALDDDAPETFKKEVIEAIATRRDRRVTPGLIKHLSDDSLKFHIISALGKLKDDRSFKALMKALSDEDRNVRLAAIGALAELKDRRSVKPLIKALATASPEEKMEIVHALGEIGDPQAVPAIMGQVGSSRSHGAALQALAQLGSGEAILEILRHPSYYSCLPYRRHSRRDDAARKKGIKKIAAYMVEVMKNGDSEQRRAATAWLSIHIEEVLEYLKEDDLIESLDDPRPDVRSHIAKILVAKGTEKARKALLDLAISSGSELSFLSVMDRETATGIAMQLLRRGNSDVRYYAASWLTQRRTPEGEKALIAAISDPNKRVKSAAIEFVRRRQIKAAVPVLAETLRSKDVEAKRLAVNALSAMGDDSVVDVLTSVLKTAKGTDSKTRETAAARLSRAKEKRAFDVFITGLNDPDQTVREYCIGVLGTFKDKRAIEPLIKAATRANMRAPERIGQALRKIDRGRAAKSLIALIAEPDKVSPTVVGNVARALAAVGDKSAIEPLKKLLPLFERNSYARQSMVDALWRLEGKNYESEPAADDVESEQASAETKGRRQSQVDPSAYKKAKRDSRRLSFEGIKKDLGSRDPFDREGAIYALAEVKGGNAKEAQDLIIKYLENDKSSDVRIAAATVLGEEKTKRGAPALIEALQNDKDQEVREAAAEALGNLGDSRAIARLVAALGDNDDWTQDAAEDALISISDDHQDAVVSVLRKNVNHANKSVRVRIKDILKELTNEKFPEEEK